jgi:cytochrome c oxidase subunit I
MSGTIDPSAPQQELPPRPDMPDLPGEGVLTRGEQLRRLPSRELRMGAADSRLVLTHMVTALVALLLGGIAGLLQSLQRSGRLDLPEWMGYYQLVTAHGILMAIVFTSVFILGFLYAGLAAVTDGELYAGPRVLAWAGYAAMMLGGVLVIVPLLAGEATVLYTFYAPMQAHPAFYIGLALFVIGTWLGGAAIFTQYASWRRAYGARTTPLFAFMAVATMLVWQVATIGVAAEVLLQLIPWSLGWTDTVDVLLSRTLFWFFGHPLVYFWLMPAYIAWYLVMPKLIGGRVFSDNLARLSFMLLIVFSIPVGLHHQLMEPGIDHSFKLFQVVLTFAVVIPSLVTAFSLWATMELAGRARGYGGWFGWLRGLPWRDARFLALMMGMLVFIPGGAGGLVLASFNLNQVAHNTIFVTGHFHLTVATAVALTFIGTMFWLVPHAAGRRITPRANRWMLAQVWTWVIGMAVMSGAQHIVGLMGAPRRTKWIDYGPNEPIAASWGPYQMAMAVGGTILFVSVVLAFGIVIYLMTRAPRETATEPREQFHLADPPRTGLEVPWWLERWRLWLAVLGVLILAAYSGPIVQIFAQDNQGSPRIQSFKGSEGGNTLPSSEPAAGSRDEPPVATSAPQAAVAGTTVDVELGEDAGKLYVRTSVPQVEAGTVTFAVTNVGAMLHELVVLRTDVPADELPQADGGKVQEPGRIAAVPDLAGGAPTAYVTLDLEAGSYVLLCNVPGHHALGQSLEFTVT